MGQSCRYCSKKLDRKSSVYCTNKSQGDFAYYSYITKWKKGEVSGLRGIYAQNISRHLRRYLEEKYPACSLCGWNTPHPVTGRAPLEIDHMDGNSSNNAEENLRLVCPNCHALTGNFRNLNKGNGRTWRRLKYIKGTK